MSGQWVEFRDWSLWSVEARLVVTEPTALAEASGLVDACLAGVEQAASRFDPGSELSRLRPGPDGTVVVGPVLADLVEAALAAARETDGMVDPTLGDALAGLGYERGQESEADVEGQAGLPYSVLGFSSV